MNFPISVVTKSSQKLANYSCHLMCLFQISCFFLAQAAVSILCMHREDGIIRQGACAEQKPRREASTAEALLTNPLKENPILIAYLSP